MTKPQNKLNKAKKEVTHIQTEVEFAISILNKAIRLMDDGLAKDKVNMATGVLNG